MPRLRFEVVEKGRQDALRRLAEKHRAVVRAVDVGALLVQGEAVRLIQQGPKTGRIYTHGGITHQASAPGEAPASDTGTLQASVQPDYILDTSVAKITHVVARTHYADYLEGGTARISPRPFMSTAFVKMKDRILDMVKRAAGGKA